MAAHEIRTTERIGESTGTLLQRAGCFCGWVSCVWYANPDAVVGSYQMHLDQIDAAPSQAYIDDLGERQTRGAA